MYKGHYTGIVERLAATVRTLDSETLLGKVLSILGGRRRGLPFTEIENFERREPGIVGGGHGRC